MLTPRCFVVAASVVMILGRTESVMAQGPATHPVVHVEILGADAPRLQRFYSDLFGWKVALNPAGYGYVPVAPRRTGDAHRRHWTGRSGRPLAVFYVKVDDPAATLRRVEALGGRVVVPPVDVPGGITFARFADPEGNVIGIVRRNN
jgi:predicted enzyme related to lactoylglutathione lyase